MTDNIENRIDSPQESTAEVAASVVPETVQEAVIVEEPIVEEIKAEEIKEEENNPETIRQEEVSAAIVEEQKLDEKLEEVQISAENVGETAETTPVEEAASTEEVKYEDPNAGKIIPQGPPKWYIVQTLTGLEDKVKSRIEKEIENHTWSDRIFRVLVPEEETVEIKGDKRIERKKKMYPGYVFVEMILDDDVWFVIRQTNGVARFIGGKTQPVPVLEREMQRVLKQIGIKEKEITVEFTVGEAIRIISGSFRGYTGSVSEINAAKSKLKAMINIFGRDTSVEVDFDRVEKII